MCKYNIHVQCFSFKNKILGGLFILALVMSFGLMIAVPVTMASSPTSVWVDDDFTTGTPGWGTTHFDTIQVAIDAAANGDTINVAAGTYTENVVVNKLITLQGEGRDVVTVTAANPTIDVFFI